MSWPGEALTLADLSSIFDDNPNKTQEIAHVGEQNVDKEMVGLDIGNSSHNKQKKLRSDVWKMFVKCKDKDGKDLAKCSLCEKLFNGSSKKGTTHLRNHLKSCQKKRNEGGASGNGDKPARNSVTDQQLNHLDRVKMLIKQRDWDLPNPMRDDDIINVYNEEKEGGASGSGDKPARNSVTDQQLNHLDRVKMLIKQHDWDLPNPIRDEDIISVYNEEKEGGASGSGDKPARNSVTDQQLNHLDRVKMLIKQRFWDLPNPMRDDDIINVCNEEKEGGASGSGYKPARNSVTDQQLNYLDRVKNEEKEGGASGSGYKPARNFVTDQQLNYLDRVNMLIKQRDWDLPNPIRDDDIINVYNEEKEKLRIYFEKLCCRFSLMIRNIADGKYTCFMVSFIDDDWKLVEKIIGFNGIEWDQNMKVLENVLSDLGIDNNISSMVTNGDSDIYVLSSDERETRFSCQGSLLSNCKFCVRDFYDIDMSCPGFENVMADVLYDHMSKILNYITETSSKIGTFQIAIDRARSLGKEVIAEDIPTEEKLKDMSSLDLVKIALGLKEAFFELENMDLHFKSINLTKEQWDVITTSYYFWDEEDDFDQIPWQTANMYFPVLCRMYKKSLVLVTLNSFICGERHLQFVREAKKCWDQSNLILAVAAVLDPRFKMDIVKYWYKKIYGDECETQLGIFTDYFTGVYNGYAKGTKGSKEKKSSISYRMLDISGYPSHDLDSGWSLDCELHLYLEQVNFPLIEGFDILEWWRVCSWCFPTLAKMARDFLSIKVTVPY